MDKLLPCIYDLYCSIDNLLIQKLVKAHGLLGRLMGEAKTIPNDMILLNTLRLQEAQGSSAIENIHTTTEKLYREEDGRIDPATKEVRDYEQAIIYGQKHIKEKGFINNRLIKEIQEILIKNNAGFRKTPGTEIKNGNEVIYTPPQNPEDIKTLMDELEKYINDETLETNALIKMALIHYQFESIHPFYDGNGRIGRIINILFLIKENLLDSPILYLSRYIVKHKVTYYHLLKKMEDSADFYEWVDFMLNCIIATAESTLGSIQEINTILKDYNMKIKEIRISRRRDLIDHIFLFPITTRNILKRELKVSYLTAGKYLEQLTNIGILEEITHRGIFHYYNKRLFDLLSRTMP